MERKTKKHRQYSIEEKNEIVKMYLSGETAGLQALAKDLDVRHSMIQRWIRQFQEFGTTVDRRVKATKKDNPNIGRPKKPMKLEDMSKEELIKHIKMIEEDFKNKLRCLIKKNTTLFLLFSLTLMG
jgi:transposase